MTKFIELTICDTVSEYVRKTHIQISAINSIMDSPSKGEVYVLTFGYCHSVKETIPQIMQLIKQAEGNQQLA